MTTAAAPGRASDPVRAIAQAVLYEGYLLWPYRRSALKNRRRWTFGGVHPPAWSRAHPDDRAWAQVECLLEGHPDDTVDVEARFLHVVERQPARLGPAGFEPVDELEVQGQLVLAWDEAAERSAEAAALRLGALDAPRRVPIDVPEGAHEEPVGPPARPIGAIRRRWQELRGTLEVCAARLAPRCFRLRATIANETSWDGGDRETALRHSFLSTHLVLRAPRARFVSQTDPPAAWRAEAERCRNVGTWPVLVGEPASGDTMLASPIILEDYPRIAPESPGDLFDASEIDQLLVLNLLALSDAERREMAASDPRAREILARTESLSAEDVQRLHGAIRDVRVLGDGG